MMNYFRALKSKLNPQLSPLEVTAPSPTPIPNLSGDRDMEWTYVAARIGRYADEQSYVLDFGCGIGVLSFAAASIKSRVLAIDLMPLQFETGYSNIEFRQADVMTLNGESEQFDLILNCSTIEHVGLSGRYNTNEAPDGDLAAMDRMRHLLKPTGHMLLTLPVGQDAVIKPLHRIYGRERLSSLLQGYQIVESTFWRKNQHNVWINSTQDEAMMERGNEHYYALGFMVLQLA